jgi:hypothetical protein
VHGRNAPVALQPNQCDWRYHRPDHDTVLPRVIAEANPVYRIFCGVCYWSKTPATNGSCLYAKFFY